MITKAALQEMIETRFFSKVVYSDDCWDWKGSVASKYGHGVFCNQRKKVMAYRWSYEYFIGKIPDGLLVCHHCDNGRCVNPFHLFVGTQKDNMKDASVKKRLGPQNGRHFNDLKTHCPQGHEYDEDNVYKPPSRINKRYRQCLKCIKARVNKTSLERKLKREAITKIKSLAESR